MQYHNTGSPTAIPKALRKAAVGNAFVIALLHDDTILAWGDNRHRETTIPPSLKNMRFKDVGASLTNALALGVDGRVYAWGENTYGNQRPHCGAEQCGCNRRWR